MGHYKGRVQLRLRKKRFAKDQRIKALADSKKGNTTPPFQGFLKIVLVSSLSVFQSWLMKRDRGRRRRGRLGEPNGEAMSEPNAVGSYFADN